ncbi:hypothetical protein CABS01_07502 [Colletotrichum abscissum]|uniref:Uncharacterized protein n=1 Tax=Colletotrichum abscissum TaxID=1671311 RepID=A0A9Q0BAC8_9PEZI|nr:uncharacterized protein CABS01_07502 [Colletotrichum abscissum]KAI3558542.1 hypothetical protein CABS02_01157 [Colletotrichum abscissum]KAK1511544.1 hypothetical protein CABS01_07502 [Colletotrichum abscissum]
MVDMRIFWRYLEWVARTEADDWLFLTSLITTLYLLYVACTTGVRFKKIIGWVFLGFVESMVLFIRGNREGLDLADKQRLLFLWAGQLFTCFVLFLWSLQDSSLELDESLKKG